MIKLTDDTIVLSNAKMPTTIKAAHTTYPLNWIQHTIRITNASMGSTARLSRTKPTGIIAM